MINNCKKKYTKPKSVNDHLIQSVNNHLTQKCQRSSDTWQVIKLYLVFVWFFQNSCVGILPKAKLGEIKQVLVLICFFMRIVPF